MGSSFSLTNLSNNHYHHIIDNIYIGDCYSIYEKFFTKKTKIVVINATRDVPFNKNLKAINHRIPVEDNLQYNEINNMYKMLPNVVKIIKKYKDKNYTILVHCVAGKQRSCAIVAAYLMKYNNLSYKESINFIKNKRPFAFFGNVNFKLALKTFYKHL